MGNPVMGLDVAKFLGQDDNPEVISLAGEHVTTITAMVKAYTRGGGFDERGNPNEDVAEVIKASTARLVANPEQLRYSAGSVSIQDSFRGWTLAEHAILNRYRKRAL